jgi:hypothetical protein
VSSQSPVGFFVVLDQVVAQNRGKGFVAVLHEVAWQMVAQNAETVLADLVC